MFVEMGVQPNIEVMTVDHPNPRDRPSLGKSVRKNANRPKGVANNRIRAP